MERNPDHLEKDHVMIGAEGTEPVGAEPRSGEAFKRELDEELDAVLACTFPASDPIGCIRVDSQCCEEPETSDDLAAGKSQ
jgi:hypothetical protein